MSVKQKIIKSATISGLGNVVIAIIGFALLPFLVGRLGAEEYGLIGFAKVFSVFGAVGAFDFGLRQSITKFVAQYKAEGNEGDLHAMITSSLLFLFLLGLSLALLGISVSRHITAFLTVPEHARDQFQLALNITFFSYLFGFPGLIFVSVFQGLQRFDYSKGTEVGRIAFNAILSVGLVFSGYGFVAIIAGSALASFIQVCLNAYLTRKCLPGLRWRLQHFSPTALREIIRFNKYLFSAQISGLLGNHAEKVFITLFLSPVYMTMYEVLIKLPRFIRSSFSFLGVAVMPAASELAALQDDERNRKLFVQGLRFNMMLSYPVCICAIFLAPDFLAVWVGAEYINLVPLLQAMLTVNFINPLVTFGWTVLLGMNRKIHYISRVQWTTTFLKVGIIASLLPVVRLWAVVMAYGAVIAVLPVSIYVFVSELGVSFRSLVKDVFLVSVISALPAVLFWLFREHFVITSLVHIATIGIVWLMVVWPAFYGLVMDRTGRDIVKKMIFGFPLFNKLLINLFRA